MDHPVIGPARFEGNPIRFSSTGAGQLALGPAARRGQRARLQEIVGVSDDEFDELAAEGDRSDGAAVRGPHAWSSWRATRPARWSARCWPSWAPTSSRWSRQSGSPTRAIGPVRPRPGRPRPQPRRSGTTTPTSAAWSSTTARRTAGPRCSGSWPSADVCITTLRPDRGRGGRPRGFDELRAASERLVVVSVTPFGLTGPWADRVSSDLVGLALGSPLNSCGYDDHSIPPIRPGGDQGYQSAASFAQMGVMLALIERERTGQGPGGRRRHARLPGRRRRAGQPVLVLPEGRRAPADLPPRPADAHAAGDLPLRRRPLGLLRDLRRRAEGLAVAGRVARQPRPRRRPGATRVRRSGLPPAELRPHPGGGRDVLPAADGRRGLPRGAGPRAGHRADQLARRPARPTSTSRRGGSSSRSGTTTCRRRCTPARRSGSPRSTPSTCDGRRSWASTPPRSSRPGSGQAAMAGEGELHHRDRCAIVGIGETDYSRRLRPQRC